MCGTVMLSRGSELSVAFPFGSQQAIYTGIYNAPVAPIGLTERALIPQAAFLHDPARARIAWVVLRFYSVCPDLIKEEGDDRTEGLRGDPCVPPLTADAISDMNAIKPFIFANNANRTDRLSKLL